MRNLLYLLFLIPSICFAGEPFFAGTAANALHANIADRLTAGTTAYGATGLVGGTYNYYGTNPVTMNAQNAVSAGTCTGNAATATNATNSTQLNGQPASYYATQSAVTAVQGSTVTAGVQVPSIAQFNTLTLSTITAGVQVPSIAQYNATALSTGSLYTQLQSTSAALSVYESAVMTSTGSIQTQINNIGLSTGTIYSNLNSTAAALSVLTSNVINSTTSLQTQINNIGISTGNITTNFNTFVTAVNVSTTNTNAIDNNQNQQIGVLQNNLFAYGGQQIVNVNYSTGTSFVNVDTTTYAPGIGLKNSSEFVISSPTVANGFFDRIASYPFSSYLMPYALFEYYLGCNPYYYQFCPLKHQCQMSKVFQ